MAGSSRRLEETHQVVQSAGWLPDTNSSTPEQCSTLSPLLGLKAEDSAELLITSYVELQIPTCTRIYPMQRMVSPGREKTKGCLASFGSARPRQSPTQLQSHQSYA